MANNDSTRPDFDFSPFNNQDPLSIRQAACLWAGVYPRQPNEAAWVWLSRLEIEAKAGRLPYEKPVDKKKVVTSRRYQPEIYHWEDDWSAALVARADLRAFAESIGQRPAFLFPESVEVSALRCLDKSDPHFSEELEAAILAWQYASEQADNSKKKPRALIVEWLQENRPGLGKASKALERVATLANWEKTTGPKALK